jgi:hypothetical protein
MIAGRESNQSKDVAAAPGRFGFVAAGLVLWALASAVFESIGLPFS